MRVRTHLIAMPWSPPDTPSIQIACLKAHLDRAAQPGTDCRAYSAFFSILHGFKGRSFRHFFYEMLFYGEHVYQALHLRRFGPPECRGREEAARLLRALREPSGKALSPSVLDGLERATCRYLDRRVAPNVITRGTNLVGFTLNYDQVYASLYAAEYLRRRFPERHFLFVYGGCTPSFPNVYRLMVDLGVPGVVVIGEGEKKLELLVRTLAELPPAEAPTALAAVAGLDPGIIVIGEPVDLATRDPARHATQIDNLGELAVPDYDEYFDALREACADEETYVALRAATDLFVEGSRGCFGRCDFCAMNQNWHGFRKRPAERIVRDTLDLTRKYHPSHLIFADNVCDAWAADYARLLLQAGMRQRAMMELRASHPEEFWTALALAGVEFIQVGVEALSPPLLKRMGKGTRVVQNLAAHKYLAELGIRASNQLITHHPRSTVADVQETRRILAEIPHWGPFRPVKFQLMAGSPLYEGLSRDERAALRPTQVFRLPAVAARYASASSLEVPDALGPPRDVVRAWDAFVRDYGRACARQAAAPRLDVVRVAPDTLRITGTRDGTMLARDVSGADALIYDNCHRASTLADIVQATGLSSTAVEAGLARFLRSKLVMHIDDRYLSLAMRPRDELICRALCHAGSNGAGRSLEGSRAPDPTRVP